MKITNERRTVYRYSERVPPRPSGITITCHEDFVPAEIRSANDAIGEQHVVESLALSEVGALQSGLQKAKDLDRHAYGAALADGLPDPGQLHEAGIAEQIQAGTRRAEAAQVARTLLVDRLKTIMRDTDLLPVAAKYDSVVLAKLAECREHLAAAEVARNEASSARGMSRDFDAYPLSANDPNGRPTSNPDAWRTSRWQINDDLKAIEESTPLGLLDAADVLR